MERDKPTIEVLPQNNDVYAAFLPELPPHMQWGRIEVLTFNPGTIVQFVTNPDSLETAGTDFLFTANLRTETSLFGQRQKVVDFALSEAVITGNIAIKPPPEQNDTYIPTDTKLAVLATIAIGPNGQWQTCSSLLTKQFPASQWSVINANPDTQPGEQTYQLGDYMEAVKIYWSEETDETGPNFVDPYEISASQAIPGVIVEVLIPTTGEYKIIAATSSIDVLPDDPLLWEKFFASREQIPEQLNGNGQDYSYTAFFERIPFIQDSHQTFLDTPSHYYDEEKETHQIKELCRLAKILRLTGVNSAADFSIDPNAAAPVHVARDAINLKNLTQSYVVQYVFDEGVIDFVQIFKKTDESYSEIIVHTANSLEANVTDLPEIVQKTLGDFSATFYSRGNTQEDIVGYHHDQNMPYPLGIDLEATQISTDDGDCIQFDLFHTYWHLGTEVISNLQLSVPVTNVDGQVKLDPSRPLILTPTTENFRRIQNGQDASILIALILNAYSQRW